MRVGDLIESRKEVYTVSEESSVHQVEIGRAHV